MCIIDDNIKVRHRRVASPVAANMEASRQRAAVLVANIETSRQGIAAPVENMRQRACRCGKLAVAVKA
jgi:hypothetical protein